MHVVVYQGATKFVKHYPVTSFLYILGLGLMCFATGRGAARRNEGPARDPLCACPAPATPQRAGPRARCVRACDCTERARCDSPRGRAAPGLMPSEEASDEYSRLLREADYENTLVDQAELKYAKQNARYQQTRGFLGFSCDARWQRALAARARVPFAAEGARPDFLAHSRCNREYKILQDAQRVPISCDSMHAHLRARERFTHASSLPPPCCW